MFNLDLAIARWRRQMIADGIKFTVLLDELESHLRDDVDQQMSSGAPAEEAFREAVQRIGPADNLQEEFTNAGGPPLTSRQKLLRICCAVMALFILLIETWTLLEFEMTPAERVLGFALILSAASYVAALPRLHRAVFRGVRGLVLGRTISAICNFGSLLLMSSLWLSLFGLIILPSEGLFYVVFWSIVCSAMTTCIVIPLDTDCDSLGVWTSSVMQSFEAAHEQALRFHHDFIGTEHLLLGLLELETGTASKALAKLGVNRDAVRAEIEKIVGSGPQAARSHPLRSTPRANRAIRLAIKEANALRQRSVGTEHVLLGLLIEGSGVAGIVLRSLGVSTENAGREILREMRLA